ncbi:MAG: hypothetical protein P4M00_24645 [Azospirillaceae bacterium]|nr:hypothetical protein [Azospirillaceae bacterium]
MDETTVAAALPHLDLEVTHGRSADGRSDYVALTLTATPGFAAVADLLRGSNPFLLWTRFATLVWAPWLALGPVVPVPGAARDPAQARVVGSGRSSGGTTP